MWYNVVTKGGNTMWINMDQVVLIRKSSDNKAILEMSNGKIVPLEESFDDFPIDKND